MRCFSALIFRLLISLTTAADLEERQCNFSMGDGVADIALPVVDEACAACSIKVLHKGAAGEPFTKTHP